MTPTDPPISPLTRLRIEADTLERLRARFDAEGDEALVGFLERELNDVHTRLLDLECPGWPDDGVFEDGADGPIADWPASAFEP